MSEFVFNCPFCDQSIAADDSLCGEPDVCPNCENNIFIPIPGLEPGVQFGDFELEELLGSGATGEVWKARQLSMNRIVALKVLLPNLTTNKNFIERFKQEAHHSAKLSHPMIVTAYYYGQDKGIHYLAITYVEGKTIADKLKKGKIYTEAKALGIIRGISTALAYAWNDFRIIHRDIKPENIMIDIKGNPMLLDLGIAKSTDEEMGLTMTGMVIGTPYYMSPEQAKGHKNIDFRADIYSLGATLYHMVVGKVPYSADSTMAIMLKHLNDELPSPREKNPSISINTEKIIKKMMEKDRDNRYQSWENLIEDIDRVLKKKKVIHAKKVPKSSKSSFKSFLILFFFTIVAAGIAAGFFYVKKLKKLKIFPINIPIIQADKGKITPKLQNKIENITPKAEGKTADVSEKKATTSKNSEKKAKLKRTNKTLKATNKKSTPQKVDKKVSNKKTKIDRKKYKEKKNNEVVKHKKGTTSITKVEGDKKDNTLVDQDDIQLGDNPKSFKYVAEKLDEKKHSIVEIENYWDSIVGTRFSWNGIITYYRSQGVNELEIRVSVPGAKLFNDYNVVLHLKTNKETMKQLGKNRMIVFEGEVYKKQPIKNTGAVVIHMKDIKKLGIY